MPDEPVLDWGWVIHKNVRIADGEPAGNIVAIQDDTIFIESQSYRIHAAMPKSLIASFNDAEVTLKKPFSELSEYIRR